MKAITAISVCAFIALSTPVLAQSNEVDNRNAPGGMNNGISAGEQRGDSPSYRGDMYEGRAAAPDYYQNGGNGVNGVDHRAAPGGLNNGLSPAIQHAD